MYFNFSSVLSKRYVMEGETLMVSTLFVTAIPEHSFCENVRSFLSE